MLELRHRVVTHERDHGRAGATLRCTFFWNTFYLVKKKKKKTHFYEGRTWGNTLMYTENTLAARRWRVFGDAGAFFFFFLIL